MSEHDDRVEKFDELPEIDLAALFGDEFRDDDLQDNGDDGDDGDDGDLSAEDAALLSAVFAGDLAGEPVHADRTAEILEACRASELRPAGPAPSNATRSPGQASASAASPGHDSEIGTRVASLGAARDRRAAYGRRLLIAAATAAVLLGGALGIKAVLGTGGTSQNAASTTYSEKAADRAAPAASAATAGSLAGGASASGAEAPSVASPSDVTESSSNYSASGRQTPSTRSGGESLCRLPALTSSVRSAVLDAAAGALVLRGELAMGSCTRGTSGSVFALADGSGTVVISVGRERTEGPLYASGYAPASTGDGDSTNGGSESGGRTSSASAAVDTPDGTVPHTTLSSQASASQDTPRTLRIGASWVTIASTGTRLNAAQVSAIATAAGNATR